MMKFEDLLPGNKCKVVESDLTKLESFDDIVDHYLTEIAPYDEDKIFAGIKKTGGFDAVIEHAGKAMSNVADKRSTFPHQRRIADEYPDALDHAYAILRTNRAKLESYKDFVDTWGLLTDLFERQKLVRGIGELYVYDTACRLGIAQGYEPQHIYSHAGTEEGLALLGIVPNTVIAKSELTAVVPEFERLTPAQLEDVLCIYRGIFKRLLKQG